MKKGLDKERDLVNYLYSLGFAAVRVAGSGAGTKRDTCDILAGKEKDIYAIELKSSSKDNIYIDRKQIRELIRFSRRFGAKPRVAVKFTYEPYLFLRIQELRGTKKGNYKFTRKMVRYATEKRVLA